MSIADRLAARAARGWAARLSPETRKETVAKAREELPRLQGAARKGDKRAAERAKLLQRRIDACRKVDSGRY